MGVKPEACVVFEDALNGIAAAQAAGMRVVAITGTNPAKVLAAARPWRVVDSFAELPDLA
ncbi:MAG: HAD family phosphatase [Kiritimatiellae bacterium]|nr:HAD family phosphatase [Kiritimatiellia bacterium]